MSDVVTDASLECAWQVTDLTTGQTLGAHADQALPIVSISKVAWTVALYRLSDRGEVDPARPVTLSPDGRSRGTTGISAMSDPVTLSLRDAAYLALTISDNAAGDALWDALPAGAVQREMAALGLCEIRLSEPMRDLYDRIAAARDRVDPWSAATTNTATPRALVRLLELIWTDTAASPAACARIRDLMTRQVWDQRLARAFPARDIAVAGKTATADAFRHEIGVVCYPGPRCYAVAVLTHALSVLAPDHRADAAIGEIVRRAIHQIRRSR